MITRAIRYIKLSLYCYIVWLQQNPRLVRIIIMIVRIIIIIVSIYLHHSVFDDVLYCADDNIDMSPDKVKEHEDIKDEYEETKKRLKSYKDMDKDGRRYQEYWHKLKDNIKLTKKEKAEISGLLGVKFNDIEKAVKNNDIEYFRDLRYTSKGLIADSKYDSIDLRDKHKDFIISKGLNPDDYPLD